MFLYVSVSHVGFVRACMHQSIPPPGVIRLNVMGEIVKTTGFEDSHLYIEYELGLPDEWQFSPRYGCMTCE